MKLVALAVLTVFGFVSGDAQNNVDLFGPAFSSAPSIASAAECADLCLKERDCWFYSWDEATLQCEMKSQELLAGLVKSSGVVSGNAEDCFTPCAAEGKFCANDVAVTKDLCSLKCTSDPTCSAYNWDDAKGCSLCMDFPQLCQVEKDKRFTGTAVNTSIAPSVGACAISCTEECKAISYDVATHVCETFSEAGSLEDKVNVISTGTSCLLFKSCQPNVIYIGPEMGVLEGTTAEACNAACLDDTVCVGYTFESGDCLLMKSITSKVHAQDAQSGTRNCCLKVDKAYTGEPISPSVTVQTEMECTRACQKDNTCKVYTWDNTARTCSLFTEETELVDAPNSVSGPQVCNEIHGWSIRSKESKPVEVANTVDFCRILCANDEKCVGYSFDITDCVFHYDIMTLDFATPAVITGYIGI